MSKPIKDISKATHAYIGLKPCGCLVAVTLDLQDCGKKGFISECLANGYAVNRVLFEEFQAMKWGCKCAPPSLGGSLAKEIA